MSEQLKSTKKRMSTENLVGLIMIAVFLPIFAFNMIVFILSIVNPSQIPMPLGIAPLVVASDSMTIREDAEHGGAFNKGDMILVRKIKPEKLEELDIITYNQGNEIITHRVIRIENINEVYEQAVKDYEAAKEAYDLAPEGEEKEKLKEAAEAALMNQRIQYSRKVVSEKRGFDTIYVTMGDYSSTAEIDVYEDQIQALYTGIRFPLLGNVLEFFQKPLGICLIICVPVGIYFAYEIIKRTKSSKASEEKIAELEARLAQQNAKQQEETEEENKDAE